MKRLLLTLLGVAIGIAAARRFAASPQGEELLASLDARAREFGATVAESYRSRQAELRAAIGDSARK